MELEAFLERFVAVLTTEGWTLDPPEDWRQGVEMGAPVDMVLPRAQGELYAAHPPKQRHVSISILDDDAKEFVEIGFEYAGFGDLESGLHCLVAAQSSVLPRSVDSLVQALMDSGLAVQWEHQGEQLDPATPENIHSDRYLFPLLT